MNSAVSAIVQRCFSLNQQFLTITAQFFHLRLMESFILWYGRSRCYRLIENRCWFIGTRKECQILESRGFLPDPLAQGASGLTVSNITSMTGGGR